MDDAAGMANAIPRVRAVEYAGPEYMVSVAWDDGREEEIDLAPLLFRYKVFRPLRRLERFAGVEVAEHGYGLAWPPDDDLEVGPEQLAELAAGRAPDPAAPEADAREIRAMERRLAR